MIASFGNKKFKVNNNSINTFNDLKITESLNINTNSKNDGKSSVSTADIEPISISFYIELNSSLGVSPEKEIKIWEDKLYAKIPEYLYLGTKKASKNPLIITKIAKTNIKLDTSGNIVFCKLDFELTEKPKPQKNTNNKVTPGIKPKNQIAPATNIKIVNPYEENTKTTQEEKMLFKRALPIE